MRFSGCLIVIRWVQTDSLQTFVYLKTTAVVTLSEWGVSEGNLWKHVSPLMTILIQSNNFHIYRLHVRVSLTAQVHMSWHFSSQPLFITFTHCLSWLIWGCKHCVIVDATSIFNVQPIILTAPTSWFPKQMLVETFDISQPGVQCELKTTSR